MTTPITASADDYQIRAVAQKLERDRAALMEFLIKLERMAGDDEFSSSDFRKTCRYDIRKALAAARANFPQS